VDLIRFRPSVTDKEQVDHCTQKDCGSVQRNRSPGKINATLLDFKQGSAQTLNNVREQR